MTGRAANNQGPDDGGTKPQVHRTNWRTQRRLACGRAGAELGRRFHMRPPMPGTFADYCLMRGADARRNQMAQPVATTDAARRTWP